MMDVSVCVCVRMCVCVSPRCTTYFKDPSPPLPAWKNGWQIISPKKSYSVFAASPTEKVEWMAHIQKCINDLLAKSE